MAKHIRTLHCSWTFPSHGSLRSPWLKPSGRRVLDVALDMARLPQATASRNALSKSFLIAAELVILVLALRIKFSSGAHFVAHRTRLAASLGRACKCICAMIVEDGVGVGVGVGVSVSLCVMRLTCGAFPIRIGSWNHDRRKIRSQTSHNTGR